MDATLAAVVGVAAGSVASVGAQLAVGRSNRRNDAIAGACIIYGALADASATLRKLDQPGHPRVTITTNLTEHEATWDEHKSALARATNIEAFHRIQVAFVDLGHIRDALAATADGADLNERARRLLAGETYLGRIERIERARELAFAAGVRVTDRPRLALMRIKDKDASRLG